MSTPVPRNELLDLATGIALVQIGHTPEQAALLVARRNLLAANTPTNAAEYADALLGPRGGTSEALADLAEAGAASVAEWRRRTQERIDANR